MSRALTSVPGSILTVATSHKRHVALQAALTVEYVVLVDASGSMSTNDSNGQTRYAAACSELARLQAAHPGQIAVFGFSDVTEFHPGGIPRYQGGGTNMLNALETVQPLDGHVKTFYVVSDGLPDLNTEQAILRLARKFRSPISTIYVGPEHDSGARAFMLELAQAGRGAGNTAYRVLALADQLEHLLPAAENH